MAAMNSRAMGLASLLAVVIAAATGPVVAAAPPARTPARPAAAPKPAPRQVLPWIEDDYTRAVAQAKARKLPIFVESWAPW
jgi:hypothetical protein